MRMRKLYLTWMFITLAATAAKADNIQVVHLEENDSLGALLLKQDVPDSLVITGLMKVQDFRDLRLYCLKNRNVTGLNLHDVEISNNQLPDSALSFGYAYTPLIGLRYVALPGQITSIGKNAMLRLVHLQHVEMPETVTDIQHHAFSECSSLQEIVLPPNLKTIGSTAFAGCNALQEVKLPEGLTRIEKEAFYETGIQEIYIPESVNYIGTAAFYFSQLREVTLPAALRQLPENAFNECANLERITCLSPQPPAILPDNDQANWLSQTVVWVPKGAGEAYRLAEGWCKCKSIEEKDLTNISRVHAGENSDSQSCYRIDGMRVNAPRRGLYIKGRRLILR